MRVGERGRRRRARRGEVGCGRWAAACSPAISTALDSRLNARNSVHGGATRARRACTRAPLRHLLSFTMSARAARIGQERPGAIAWHCRCPVFHRLHPSCADCWAHTPSFRRAEFSLRHSRHGCGGPYRTLNLRLKASYHRNRRGGKNERGLRRSFPPPGPPLGGASAAAPLAMAEAACTI